MKFLTQFFIAILLLLFSISCEKKSSLILDINEVKSLVHLQQDLVNTLTKIEDFDKFVETNNERIVLFENTFLKFYTDFEEEFVSLYNQIYVQEFIKEDDYILEGKVTLRSTPCYDAYESSSGHNSNRYALCLIGAFGNEIKTFSCSVNYTSAQMQITSNYELCLEANYE